MNIKSKLSNFNTQEDSRFIKCEVIVCHDKDNKNGSWFDDDVQLACAEKSIRGIPLLAHVFKNEDTGEYQLGGHDLDFELIDTPNGVDIEVTHLEKPVGFILPDSPIKQELIEDRKYIIAYGVIWRSYADQLLGILNENDNEVDVSMEITVKNSYVNENNMTVINDFDFEAITLLGCEPAMELASLKTFSMSNIKSELQEMMKQYSLERGGEMMEENQVTEVADEVKEELEVVEESNVESEEKVEETEEIQESSEFDLLKEKYEKVIKDLDDLKVSYAELEEKLNEMNDYDSLKQFKEDYDKAQYEAEIEDITSKFSFSDDEIEDIKTKALNKELSKEQYEKELYCLLGMKQIKNNSKFEKVEKSTCEVKVQNNVKISSRYGELGKKYSK